MKIQGLMLAFLASSLQFEASKAIPAAGQQPFFACQPLFAAAWGYLALGEAVPYASLVCGARRRVSFRTPSPLRSASMESL